jgi:ADP-heptose:LPS heptosyltransferase
MLYIKQTDSFRLGNFINCTPTIKALATKLGHKIPVHFETDYVKKCYLYCDFIEHIGPQKHDPLFTSALVCKKNTMPDYMFIFEQFKTRFGLTDIPHTYIDSGNECASIEKNYVLVMNGTGNQDQSYIDTKDPGVIMAEIVKELIIDGRRVVFTGSEEDYLRCASWASELPFYVNDIRHSLRLIYDADIVISNDTGLAHAAAAMNKPLYILWKDTKFPKNSNPGKNTKYVFKNDWEDIAFDIAHRKKANR